MDVIKCREEIIEEVISNFDFKRIENGIKGELEFVLENYKSINIVKL